MENFGGGTFSMVLTGPKYFVICHFPMDLPEPRWLLRDAVGALTASFFADSIFSPPLLPRMLTKPRTVWACRPVAAMISASDAPLALQ
jgi:hypothetical protein